MGKILKTIQADPFAGTVDAYRRAPEIELFKQQREKPKSIISKNLEDDQVIPDYAVCY